MDLEFQAGLSYLARPSLKKKKKKHPKRDKLTLDEDTDPIIEG